MRQPTVSVIIPTYNRDSLIEKTIQSVLDQTFKDFELIIVSDGSTDNTKQVVDSIKDKRIRFFEIPNSKRPAVPRNFGIHKSAGKYVAFLDDDDLWFKDKLQKQVDIMERDSECALVFAPFQVIGQDNVVQDHIMGQLDKVLTGNIYNQLLISNVIITSSVLIRKSVFERVGLFKEDYEYYCVEDYDLWLSIAYNFGAYGINEKLGYYRAHPENSSSLDDNCDKVLRIFDQQLDKKRAQLKDINRAKANFYFHKGWMAIEKDAKLSRKYFIKAIQINFNNFRIVFVSLVGWFLSFLPYVFSFLRKHRIDRNIGKKLFDPRNI